MTPPKTTAKGTLTGAAFLMATSAIGPGFLTQTVQFTTELLASFGFIILISFLLDLGAQLNIWRTITISGLRAQDLANNMLSGLGWALALMIGFGGLVFNIGNIAGCGLGLNALTGMDERWGALISCAVALFIFWYKEAGKLMDNFVKVLGILMILFTGYVMITARPPFGEALYRTIWPERIDVLKIVTLVGGTVGGYISFAGAHRLLEAGVSGKASIPDVNRSAVSGILLTTVMRYILFLVVLAVAGSSITGAITPSGNPAADIFRAAAGNIGQRFFGFVMWCAAITSVVGASYTSVSFFRTLHPFVERRYRMIITAFILTSTLIFLGVNKPVALLILAGAVNGIILPLALAVILLAAQKRKLVGDYKHPLWMQIAGWLVVAIMSWMSWVTLQTHIGKLF